MKLIDFPQANMSIAKDQPQYRPMPALVLRDEQGTRICKWKLTWRERLNILFNGVIWHEIWSFNQAIQPQRLSVEEPQEVWMALPHLNKDWDEEGRSIPVSNPEGKTA